MDRKEAVNTAIDLSKKSPNRTWFVVPGENGFTCCLEREIDDCFYGCKLVEAFTNGKSIGQLQIKGRERHWT